jgi:hypothetical protein
MLFQLQNNPALPDFPPTVFDYLNNRIQNGEKFNEVYVASAGQTKLSTIPVNNNLFPDDGLLDNTIVVTDPAIADTAVIWGEPLSNSMIPE